MSRFVKYLRRHHIGLAALFIALGGTSYAAVQLPKNSVGANQIKASAVGSSEIKNRSVTGTDVKNSSLTAADIKNGSLTAADFKASDLPRGATGPQGPKGETGPAGPVESYAVRLNRASGPLQIPNNAGSPQNPAGAGTANTVLTWGDANVAYEVGGTDLFDESRANAGPVPGAGAVRIPKTGTYSLSAGARWAANPDGVRALSISGPQPGGVLVTSVVNAAPTPLRTIQSASTTARLEAGALVYASVGQNSGAALNLEGSQGQVHFSVTYVGP